MVKITYRPASRVAATKASASARFADRLVYEDAFEVHMNGVQSKGVGQPPQCGCGDDLGLPHTDRLHPRKRYASQTGLLVGHDGVEAVGRVNDRPCPGYRPRVIDSKLQTSNKTPRDIKHLRTDECTARFKKRRRELSISIRRIPSSGGGGQTPRPQAAA